MSEPTTRRDIADEAPDKESWEAYEAALEAALELAAVTPYAELAALAEKSPPPQEWYDET